MYANACLHMVVFVLPVVSERVQQGRAMMDLLSNLRMMNRGQTISTIGIVWTTTIAYATANHLWRRHGGHFDGHSVCLPSS